MLRTLTCCLLASACLWLTTCAGSRRGAARAEDRDALLRREVVSYAQQFLGTPYRYGGTNPRQGFDCSGFTAYVMQEARIRLPRQSKSQSMAGKPVRPERAQPGDLIFYRRGRGPIFHVSLVVANDRRGITVVHSVSDGVVVENISQSSYWRPKIFAARDVLSK